MHPRNSRKPQSSTLHLRPPAIQDHWHPVHLQQPPPTIQGQRPVPPQPPQAPVQHLARPQQPPAIQDHWRPAHPQQPPLAVQDQHPAPPQQPLPLPTIHAVAEKCPRSSSTARPSTSGSSDPFLDVLSPVSSPNTSPKPPTPKRKKAATAGSKTAASKATEKAKASVRRSNRKTGKK
ncbi:hypothetical protein AX14_008527 [Amanita brunnescens Koide BX004]|nr:hypothetical protein AX14_008527 [Amanita brunnescens Koide BX004]